MPLICNVQNGQIHRIRKTDYCLPRATELEEMGVTANEYSVSFGDDENVLKFNMVVITQLCEYNKKHFLTG